MFSEIVRELRTVRVVLAFLLAFIPILVLPAVGVLAATADVTVNATPAFTSISCNVSEYDFGVVAQSSTTNTTTAHFGITNTSTVQTDQTIGVTTATWSGGAGWSHSDLGTAGDNTTAIIAYRTAWDITVKNAGPEYIYENCPLLTSYSFGLSLQAPTVLYDGDEKSITVRVTAIQG